MDSHVSLFFAIQFGGEAVDFLDSRHDEVLRCRSLMDHFIIYLLILP